MPELFIPTAKVIQVDTRGACILKEESPEVGLAPRLQEKISCSTYARWHGRFFKTRDSRGIYFPNYIEPVSHIAVDVSPRRDAVAELAPTKVTLRLAGP